MKKTSFWHENLDDNRLIDQILAGVKTATCAPKICYYNDYPGEEPTEIGDLVEVYNPRGVKCCIIKITDVYEIPLGRIGKELAIAENFKSLKEFRENQFYCWEKPLLKHNAILDDMTIMVVEHFKLMSA